MLKAITNRKVLKRGEPAEATVVAMSAREHGAEPSKVEMTIVVERSGEDPYELTDQWMVSGTEPVSAGSKLRIAVDPRRPRRAAIDWDEVQDLVGAVVFFADPDRNGWAVPETPAGR